MAYRGPRSATKRRAWERNRHLCWYTDWDGKANEMLASSNRSREESKVNKRVFGWEDEDIASRGINQLTYQRVSQAKGLNAGISPENLCLFHGNTRWKAYVFFTFYLPDCLSNNSWLKLPLLKNGFICSTFFGFEVEGTCGTRRRPRSRGHAGVQSKLRAVLFQKTNRKML